MSKVFCIGTWKTGTTSVGEACNILVGGKHDGGGYFGPATEVVTKKQLKSLMRSNLQEIRTRGGKLIAIEAEGDKDKIISFNTFDDMPWNKCKVIKALAEHFPNEKYVITTRDENEWHNSAYNFYRQQTQLMKENKISYYDLPQSLYHIWGEEFRYILGSDLDMSPLLQQDFSGMIKHKSIWLKWFRKRNEYVKSLFNPKNLLEINISQKVEWEPICKFLGKPIPDQPFPFRNVNNTTF